MSDHELFIISVINGEIAEVDRLLKYGVDVNKLSDGCTAIMYAICMREAQILKLLISYGGDVNIPAKSGKTAIMLAAADKNEEIFDILLEANADIHAKSNIGETALWFAVEFCNEYMVRKLIKLGADVNIVNIEGMSLCDLALKKGGNGFVEVIESAIKKREEGEADNVCGEIAAAAPTEQYPTSNDEAMATIGDAADIF